MIQLKLIGIRDTRYLQWRRNLLLALRETGQNYYVEEVNKVDEILQYGAHAIPALLINEQYIVEQNGHIPNVDEFTTYIKKNYSMKKIIVPTDFSPAAKNAFEYAKALAGATYSDLRVVHIFHPALYQDTVVVPTMDDIRKDREEKLKQFVNPGGALSQSEILTSTIETEVIKGLAVDELKQISKKEDTDFILMGTTGEGGVIANLLGSISTDVSQKARCPVWLIPPEAKFTGIKRILYAANYESADSDVVDEIADVSKLFDAEMHLVHVNETSKIGKDWEFEELVLNELFKKAKPDTEFKLHTVQSASAWKGLQEYAKDEDIDLIVMVTRHRNFWDTMFHSSMTKRMILNADKTPLLIMHVDD